MVLQVEASIPSIGAWILRYPFIKFQRDELRNSWGAVAHHVARAEKISPQKAGVVILPRLYRILVQRDYFKG